MEFMVAWYPLLKASIMVIVFIVAVALVHFKWFKTAGMLGVTIMIFAVFAPVKIDGTKTEGYHKAQVKTQVQRYKYIEKSEDTVVTKKKTFAERMAEEKLRSDTANKEVAHEISN